MFIHMILAWGAGALRLAIGWLRDCRSPLPHHQHSFDSTLRILSQR